MKLLIISQPYPDLRVLWWEEAESSRARLHPSETVKPTPLGDEGSVTAPAESRDPINGPAMADPSPRQPSDPVTTQNSLAPYYGAKTAISKYGLAQSTFGTRSPLVTGRYPFGNLLSIRCSAEPCSADTALFGALRLDGPNICSSTPSPRGVLPSSLVAPLVPHEASFFCRATSKICDTQSFPSSPSPAVTHSPMGSIGCGPP